MTPKEKAELLIERMYNSQDERLRWTPDAKNAALIAVGEIESALTEYGKEADELQNMDSEFRYWQSVKDELSKM